MAGVFCGLLSADGLGCIGCAKLSSDGPMALARSGYDHCGTYLPGRWVLHANLVGHYNSSCGTSVVFGVRFVSPVRDGDRIRIGGLITGIIEKEGKPWAECDLFVEKEDGTKAVVGRSVAPIL